MGAFPSLSNVKEDASGPKEHPPTLLVHSQLSEKKTAGLKQEPMSRAAKAQLDFVPKGDRTVGQHKAHLQEMFDHAAQQGTLGEHVRCIVSVSMLTEGWDVRSVTHIFGFRPFESQLLCEQAAGRALRRTVHADPQDNRLAGPEYASIFGIPFEFMRAEGPSNGSPPPESWRVHTVKRRKAVRLSLPQLDGYALQAPADRFDIQLDAIDVQRSDAPMLTLIAGPVGKDEIIETAVVDKRWQEFLYSIALHCVKLFDEQDRCEDAPPLRKASLFASLRLTLDHWTSAMHERHGGMQWRFQAMHLGAERIASALADHGGLIRGPVRIVPRYHGIGNRSIDTRGVDFQTTLSIRYPDPGITDKSELNAAACHSELEAATAARLDRLEAVDAWVRNFRLGWSIPYMGANGAWRRYEPDFAVRLKRPRGTCPWYLMVECKGVVDDEAVRKERYVRDWWLPAVNGSSDFAGRWRYCMVLDATSAGSTIQEAALCLEQEAGEK